MRRLIHWLAELYTASRRELLRDPAVTLFERSPEQLAPHVDATVAR